MRIKILSLILALLCGSCVIVTIKENHYHIKNDSGAVEVEGVISGSDAKDSLNGNEIKPDLEMPIP